MRSGNSRRDPGLVRAAKEMERLLGLAADAAIEASAEYAAMPRWCGRSPPDPRSNESGLPYPWNHWLCQEVDDLKEVDYPHWVLDEVSAFKYHSQLQEHLVVQLRLGLPPSIYETPANDRTETPRRYLDRVRGRLRWEHRLDSESLVTKAFALLQVRKGRIEARHGMDGKEIRVQTYEYTALPQADIDMRPAAMRFAESLHAAFRHADLALMPRNPTPVQLEFLRWLRDRGGLARMHEVVEWVDADPKRGSSSDGQGAEAKLLRNFCEKDAPRGSRRPWRIREAALELIKGDQ